jgi:hypothetical protein
MEDQDFLFIFQKCFRLTHWWVLGYYSLIKLINTLVEIRMDALCTFCIFPTLTATTMKKIKIPYLTEFGGVIFCCCR